MSWERNPGDYIQSKSSRSVQIHEAWKNNDNGDYLAVVRRGGSEPYRLVLYTEDEIEDVEGLLEKLNSLFKENKLSAMGGSELEKFYHKGVAIQRAEELTSNGSVYDHA